MDLLQLILYLGAFAIVAIAAGNIAGAFRKIRMPLITGFLVMGLVAGPEVLGMVEKEGLDRLAFLNDIALAFIAFAVGSELYLNEMRSRMRSIISMTITQMLVTFTMVSIAVFLLIDNLGFASEMKLAAKLAISMLAGTIAIARSPASAIAVIDELRARGPFTQTALGVTVVKDFGVVIFFAIVFTLSKSMIQDSGFRFIYVFQVLLELAAAFGLGFVLWLILRLVLSIKGNLPVKKLLVLLSGFAMYVFTHKLGDHSDLHMGLELHVEPLLICIIASFLVTNYSAYRNDFTRIVKELGPYVYMVFFTLTGAMISLEVLASMWIITLLIFGVRILSLFVAGYIGSSLAGDSRLYRRISWMPYVTQAGVGVGLATIIAAEYPGWGSELATIMISVIVLNQFVGPPLFKWALHMAGEVHVKADGSYDRERKVVIFGLENQSQALARQLLSQSWKVEFALSEGSGHHIDEDEFPVHFYKKTDREELEKMGLGSADTIVCLLSDEESYAICESAYEHFGTSHIVVRLQEKDNYLRFHKLGAMVIDPATAMLSLLEHFVRSPIATSLLLGMDEGQDTVDVELRNSDIHGLTLRDLRLPSDVIILSVTRGDHPIISHGYTRLRLGDIVTMVGSSESLDKVRLNLQGY